MAKEAREAEKEIGRDRRERAERDEKAARQRVAKAIVARIDKGKRGHMASVARRLGFSGPHISGIANGTKGSGWILAFAYADLCLVSPVRLIAELLGEAPPSLDDRDPRIDAAGARMRAASEDIEAAQLTRRLRPEVTSDALAEWLIEGQRQARETAERAAREPTSPILSDARDALREDLDTTTTLPPPKRSRTTTRVDADDDVPAAEPAPKSTRKPRGGPPGR